MNGQGTLSNRDILLDGLWRNNPIFRQVLGICSTLAVTNLVSNTLVMCTALTLTTGFSCLTVSLLRHYTPRNIRMMVQTLIIAFYVIIVSLILQAYWPSMSANLGPFVGLIITNCIVMGRCEAFAGSNKPLPSLFDGLVNGLGYSFMLLLVSIIRELLGMGSILGMGIPFFSNPQLWEKWIIMVMPPGAFFTLACMIWLMRSINPREDAK
jgi:Na+-transporting NADH:ubiquinone oxidoreductase subunit D